MTSAIPAYAAEAQTEEYDLPLYQTENLIEGIDYEIGEGFTVFR